MHFWWWIILTRRAEECCFVTLELFYFCLHANLQLFCLYSCLYTHLCWITHSFHVRISVMYVGHVFRAQCMCSFIYQMSKLWVFGFYILSLIKTLHWPMTCMIRTCFIIVFSKPSLFSTRETFSLPWATNNHQVCHPSLVSDDSRHIFFMRRGLPLVLTPICHTFRCFHVDKKGISWARFDLWLFIRNPWNYFLKSCTISKFDLHHWFWKVLLSQFKLYWRSYLNQLGPRNLQGASIGNGSVSRERWEEWRAVGIAYRYTYMWF